MGIKSFRKDTFTMTKKYPFIIVLGIMYVVIVAIATITIVINCITVIEIELLLSIFKSVTELIPIILFTACKNKLGDFIKCCSVA